MVVKTEEKAPVVALIVAFAITPLKVIATVPDGMTAPAEICPESVVVGVPNVIVGAESSMVGTAWLTVSTVVALAAAKLAFAAKLYEIV